MPVCARGKQVNREQLLRRHSCIRAEARGSSTHAGALFAEVSKLMALHVRNVKCWRHHAVWRSLPTSPRCHMMAANAVVYRLSPGRPKISDAGSEGVP